MPVVCGGFRGGKGRSLRAIGTEGHLPGWEPNGCLLLLRTIMMAEDDGACSLVISFPPIISLDGKYRWGVEWTSCKRPGNNEPIIVP